MTFSFTRRFLIFCLWGLILLSGGTGAALADARDELRAEIAKSPDRADLLKLYAARDFEPAWETGDSNRAGLTAFLESFAAFIEYHGFESNICPTEALRANQTDPQARTELAITDCLLKVARAMQGDDMRLDHLYPGWEFTRAKKDIPLELGEAIKTGKVQPFFDSLAPQELDYARLAAALATYRGFAVKGAWPRVPAGPTIRPGETDPRLDNVRARLAAEGYVLPAPLPEKKHFYGEDLKEAVIAYQARNGLAADGAIGGQTVAAMNVPLSARIGQIRANMERLRHMPDSFPARYVRVNIADASLRIVENGQAVFNGLVIVGRTDRKTPFIESTIRSVIVNPSWTVPDKIAREDILPKLRKNPHYLEEMGFVIKGSADDPHGDTIDWNTIQKSEFNFRLRQSPGDLNSLGHIKFDFDNDFAVYLHDTPHQELFAKPQRTLSSGCVRVKDPFVLAGYVLAANKGDYAPAGIQALIDLGKTKWIKVAEPLPLYIFYETAFFPTPESLIHFRKDVYDYDSFLLENMAAQNAGNSNHL